VAGAASLAPHRPDADAGGRDHACERAAGGSRSWVPSAYDAGAVARDEIAASGASSRPAPGVTWLPSRALRPGLSLAFGRLRG
jgi:hypothetical protein